MAGIDIDFSFESDVRELVARLLWTLITANTLINVWTTEETGAIRIIMITFEAKRPD